MRGASFGSFALNSRAVNQIADAESCDLVADIAGLMPSYVIADMFRIPHEDGVALYRLTMDAPPHNLRPRYNVCPTDPVDVVTAEEGKRELVPMRWGLIPGWWKKSLKEMRLATFNARAETVADKPMFRDSFKKRRCLVMADGFYEWQQTPGVMGVGKFYLISPKFIYADGGFTLEPPE